MGRKSTIWRNKEVTKKLGFISLGCSKNLVDTEMMVGIMEKAGYELTEDLAEAHVIIINTCTFIDPAKEESIQTILETAEYKKTGVCERLVAASHSSTRKRLQRRSRKSIFSSVQTPGRIFWML